jgi:hypothetical protein
MVRKKPSEMNLQKAVFRPVIGGLNKIIEEPVPCFLNETLETGILLLINHFYKKTSMTAPVKKLAYHSESKLAYIPTVTWKWGLNEQ